MPLRILSGKGAVQIMPFWKLGGKFHFSFGFARVSEVRHMCSLNLVTEVFVITVKGFEPATFCVRDQDVTTMPVRHM